MALRELPCVFFLFGLFMRVNSHSSGLRVLLDGIRLWGEACEKPQGIGLGCRVGGKFELLNLGTGN